MRKESIKTYLQEHPIRRRRTTFANAFASALAPHDAYSAEEVASALLDLGQDPDHELSCVYCGQPAATWDHLFNRVSAGEFSGHGHRIRNLVPSCRSCNERKGKKHWREWLDTLAPPDLAGRVAALERFTSRGAQPLSKAEIDNRAGPELLQYRELRRRVFDLLDEADRVATSIRHKLRDS